MQILFASMFATFTQFFVFQPILSQFTCNFLITLYLKRSQTYDMASFRYKFSKQIFLTAGYLQTYKFSNGT